MSPAELLMNEGTAALGNAGLVFLRIGSMTALLPGFGERSIPARVKLVVAFSLTAIVYPAVAFAAPPVSMASAWLLALAEITNGVFLGIHLRIMLFALQTAGTIAAQATSLSQLLGNASADPMPALGHALTLAGLTFLVTNGLAADAALFAINSYRVVGPGSWPLPALIGENGADHIAQSFSLAFQLAAPFYLISILYNLALGAINKAMPQLMVAFIGAPFITWSALALLFLTAVPVVRVWGSAFAKTVTGGLF